MRDFSLWFAAERDRITRDLCEYISIDTTSPYERSAYPFLRDYLSPLGFEFHELSVPDNFWVHPERCPPSFSYVNSSTKILRARRPGGVGGRKLVVNSHVDVVPLSENFATGFTPKVTEQAVVGRGAVDTKGNLIAFAEALRYLQVTSGGPSHEILLDLTVEEEIGGNGSLASVLSGIDADCALVLEPTGGEIFRGHRGCVTFAATFFGLSTHMGHTTEAVSAIDLAMTGMSALRELEAELNAPAIVDPAFNRWQRPIQINVGTIAGGEWCGSVPAKCSFLGNCGFMPDESITQLKQRLENALESAIASTFGAKVILDWPGLHNEAYLTSDSDPFCKAALRTLGQERCYAWNVSCDGRHYGRTLKIPTIIFGCGQLSQAHSDEESLYFSDLERGVRSLTELLSSPMR